MKLTDLRDDMIEKMHGMVQAKQGEGVAFSITIGDYADAAMRAAVPAVAVSIAKEVMKAHEETVEYLRTNGFNEAADKLEQWEIPQLAVEKGDQP